jgi:sugar lactone lactonase YvrE
MTRGATDGWELVIDGIDFGEGPRWHLGRLWFSDFYQGTISSVGHDRQRRIEVEYDGRPSGLGWLPDGRLLFVSMLDRRVMRRDADGTIVEHADLDGIATGHCNDMVVGPQGNAYVGNFGFDFEGGESPQPATLAIVWADGTVTAGAADLQFPNGSVITDDGSTLIVGESFGARYTAFTITHDRGLTDRRVWAEVPGMAPDGCTIDAEQAIWFADALGGQVVRVREGGEITHRLPTPDPVFACMLGGADGRTLFALTAQGTHPDQVSGTAAGALWQRAVDVPRTPTSRP